ncbi:transmembrane protein 81 [Fundulus heteroclitus]|uniref:transmembrane protein 81 n=1 Tax=Fundulus heteroclitus TaxID=8078 RepID=UPI00165C7AFE|nr:transmembrane protein 81 [Fundulus heteroclitus]
MWLPGEDKPSSIRMHSGTVLRGFLLLLPLLLPADMAEEEKVPLEVITDSSPCSVTCGLGVKTQTLCLLKDSKTAMEENDVSPPDVSQKCRVQKATCADSWQCGLRTITVTSGERVEIDCLGEVMEAMGRFTWRVSWRYARGIISSDDSLFDRWEAPLLDRVVLDPVREEDAGTYRCDVQDTSYRRVKRAYWGVRVLPAGVVNLDYHSSLTQWEVTESPENLGVLHLATGRVLLHAMVISFILTSLWVGLLFLYRTLRRRRRDKSNKTHENSFQ